jgi:glyoxylase-like metal-dependent hydrolase (beta-lactamase superfamily II)
VPDQDIERVNRGGSWVDRAGLEHDGAIDPEGGHNLLAAARTGDEQNSSDDHMGFRVAIDLTRKAVVKPVDPDLPDLTAVEIVTHPINDQMYMLEATRDTAGNIGVLVGSDGVLIVDDQFAELSPQVKAALSEISDSGLTYILNTHHHSDHSGGNSRLASDSKATIVAHDQTRIRLMTRGPANWPEVTFSDNLSIYFGGEHVRLIAVPGGHTDNDVVVLFESSNVVHMGDLMNSGISSFPVADLSSGGNALDILDNIERLLTIVPEDATIIPGHGPLTYKSELHQLHEMLVETIDFVDTRKKAGRSLQQIQAEGLPVKYAAWGTGYMNAEGWIAMVFQSIDQNYRSQ